MLIKINEFVGVEWNKFRLADLVGKLLGISFVICSCFVCMSISFVI